ncbi:MULTISPECIES: inositol 2-dehydrogenase [Pseudomonas syringae group]|uniref:Inositol 2-dehydrogenase n=1 Tax=Pseudomonas syringae pv. coriandricola TaxID=264453 RepID=A0A3M4U3A4_9PSED|nr:MULTISPECIES: inositol 2-dehydrogenase [Pseudomonas syringae group]RMR33923.1 Inositol 2-dehydrogenase [Pseudomonas syringae pv. coriandricola]RMU05211.1 Inositol 2-dehydrogenase [Pseudomonas syringae pv. coriandricola]
MLRIAVLGAGRIGKIHAANVATNPRTKLVVVADPWKEGVNALALQLGCETAYDYASAIERADVDAVLIGTPTEFHIELMLQAVRLGKPVICEKPIDMDYERAKAAVDELERLNGRVMLAFNRRFDPDYLRLRRAIDDGEIGVVRQVIITSRDPALAARAYLETSGGIFRDMTIHDFDMARSLLGEEPVEVFAVGNRLVDPTLESIPDYDSVMVLMRTASGRQCHINCCREAVYGFDQRLEVSGSKGMLLNENHRTNSVRRYGAEATDVADPLLNFFLERHADSYKIELNSFLDAVENNSPMPATPRDGLRALRLANCASESAETGKIVSVGNH